MGGPYISWGIQRIMDAQLQFVRNTLPVYLRIRNFAPVNTTLAGQLGFAVSPSGSNVGTQDILIQPPPAVSMISMHNIGMSGGKLLLGARQFMISQSFVVRQAQALGLDSEQRFWTDKKVVGIVTENFLFSIEDIGHEEMGGVTVVWSIRGNNLSLK